MKNIHKWIGKEKRQGLKFVFLSLFCLCLAEQAQGQADCTIEPANAIACYGSSTFNLSFSSTGDPDQYALTKGLRAMPGFSNVTDASLGDSPVTISIPNTIAAGIYDFDIVVANSLTSCVSISTSFTLTILPPQTITSATAEANPICSDATTTLTANGVAGENAVVTWWTASGGTGTNLGTGLTLANRGPGTYYARVTGDCSAVEASVTVSSKIDVAITSATAAVSPICSNATTTLTANGVAGTNAVVTWWTATGGTGTNLGTGLTISNRGPGTYFARVTGDCGSAVEASVTVTSNLIVAITSASAGATSVCPGGTTTLTANGVTGTNAVVTWWTASGGTGTNLGTGLTLANRGPGTYYARVTGDCGLPDEASVTVSSKVDVTITSATASASSVCPGVTTTLTANGVAGTNAVVNWWTATGGTGTNLGTGLTITNRGPGTYYAMVTGDCGSVAEASVTVASNEILTITSVTAAVNPICSNATTTLTANGVAGTNAVVTWWTATGGTGTNLGTGLTISNRGPGTYYARVTGDCGLPDEASVTVTSNLIVAIASATAGATSVCPGGTTTLTANGVTGTNAVVTWWTASGGTGTNLGTGLTLANRGPGTYYARVTGDCGSAVEASVTVSSKVDVTITSATASASSVCPGVTTTLIANGVAGTNAVVTWWTGSGGAGTNLGTGLTITNRGPGTYYARVTGDCGSAAEASVTVTSNEILTITSVTAAVNPICSNATTTLTANGVAGTNAVVTWWTATGGTGTNLGTGLTISNRGPGTYYARVTGDCGLPDEASVTVTSNLIVAIASATAGATSVCPGGTTTLTANGVTGTNAVVTWWTATGGTGTNLGTGLTISNRGPGTYYARVTGDCGLPVEASVTVTSKIAVAITAVTAGATSVCQGITTTLTANGVTGTNAVVTWWTGSGGTGTNLGTGLSLANRGPGTYYARVTGDCGSAAEASVTVTSNEILTITSVTAAVNPICSNATTTLTANGVAGTNAVVTWWTATGGTGTNLGTGLTISNRGPGTYYARVTGDCGLPDEASVTVTSNLIVAIASATAGATSVCPGGTTTLTANGVTGTNAVVTWWTATGGTGTNLGTGLTISNRGPSTYYARVTGDCGSAVEASVIVTSKIAVAIASATATVTSVCPGITTTLTANGVTGTNTAVTWWTGSGGTGTNLGTGLTISNRGPGTYYARVTGDCGSAIEASVTVTSKIAVAITSATAGAPSVCPGVTTTLTANGVTGTNAVITWWTGSGGTGTNLGTGLTISNRGPGTYYARVTGDCGSAIEASVTVTSKIAVAITSATAGAPSVCPGVTTTLTANGVTGTNAVVTWWTGSGGTGTNLGTGLSLANRGPGTYYARVTGDCGLPDEASVTVTSKIAVAITSAAAGATSVCPGITTTLTANGVTGTNAIVTWRTGSGGTGTNLGIGLTITNRGPGTYYARVTGDCGPAVEASITVTSKDNVAIISATAAASPICSNATTTLTANGVAGTNAVVTWWSATGGMGTNLGTGLTITNRGPGTYYARVTGDCGPAVEASVTVTSKVNAAIASATAAASPICSNATTTLTANGVAGTNALVTWWTATGGTGTNLGTGLTITNRGPGTYYARVTGDCGSAAEAIVIVNPKSNVAIASVTAAVNPICSNATTTLTANGVAGTNALVTWRTGSGGTGTNLGTGLTISNRGPGTYYARVTGDCGPAVEASVIITSKVNVAITSAIATANSVCPGVTTTLTANGVTGTNALVTWWTATGGTGTNLGTGLILPYPGPGTYYARVTGDCGSAVEASVKVTSKVVVAIASATADASPICSNSITTLTANGVIGNNAIVTWWTATGGTGTNLGTGLTLNNRGPGTYYARVTGDCGSANEASVTVNSKVDVAITSATAAVNPICANATTNLTANGVAGTNAIVTWWTASGGTGLNLGTGLTLANKGPGTYYARVTGDCGSAVETSVTVTLKINVAITSVSAAVNPICSNATTSLTAIGVAGTNALVTWWTASGGTGSNLGTGLTINNRGTGTYYARVTGDCGLAVEASVTVTSKINIAITSATAAVNPICENATTTLTANGVAGTNALVTWWTASGGTGTNLGTGLTINNRGPGTYYARVTGDCGLAVEASVTVTSKVNIAIASVTAAVNPICSNATTTLTANGVAGTNAIVTWWTASGGTGTNLGTGLTINNRGPGTYYARVTGDCGSAAEANVTVSSKVNIAIASVTAAVNPICSNAATTLTANGVSGTNAFVTWWTASGGTGTNLGTGLTLANKGAGTYYARVTGDCGSVVEASVTVISKVDVAITSASAIASSVCPGVTTTLTANGVSGTNATVTWWTASGGTGTNLGTGLILPYPGPGTFFARVTGDCGSAVETSVAVASNLIVAITSVSAEVNPICSNATTTLTANGVVGNNAIITWWTASGGTGTNLGTGLTINNRGPGTYYARVTGECGSAAEANVTVSSKVDLAITSVSAEVNPICSNSTTALTANGVAGTNALVTWWTASGGTGINLGTGLTINNRGPGTYYARVTGDCGLAVEASVTVTIDSQNPTIICPANVYAFSDPGKCIATGLNIGTPITADNCSVESVTNNAPVAFPIGNTLVIWTVTDKNGNKATCTQTVNVAGIIDAFNDEGSVNGSTGGTVVSNILVNDFLNCAVVNPPEVTASLISSTSPNVSLNGMSVVTAPGTIAGVYKLTYQICEIGNPNKCDQADVTVTVISTNDPPVVTGKKVTTLENTPVTICLRITDPNAVSVYTASICGNPGNGTLGAPIITGNEICIDYTPASNFSGTNNFCLELCGNGLPALCDTASVIVDVIKVNRPPVVSDIIKTIEENQSLLFSNSDFTSKFIDPENDNLVKVKITSLPLNGKLNISGTDVTSDQEILFAEISKLAFMPEKDYSGEISFSWKGSDSGNYSVSPANVYITITPQSIFISEGFSPNGDGVNDYFIIQGAEGHTIDLKIFNRWGNLVYSSKQYLNDWDGSSNSGMLISNQLPVGTYFYIVNFNNGKKEKIGYLTINR